MNRKYSIRTAIFLFLFLCMHIPFSMAHAASATNVSLENDLYRDMEFWAAEGLIESQLSSIKPIARSEAGKQIAVAMYKCSTMETPTATCKKIQNHYAKIFAAEIEEASSPLSISDDFVKPVENLSVTYEYLDGPFSIYNREARLYGEGYNSMIELQSHARLAGVFSFFLQPLVVFNEHEDFHGGDDKTEVRLHKGYAKLTLFNCELEVGRDSLWWGPGYHGALLMSNNAHPLDMIKLSNPEPVLLPWIFSYLGPVQFNLFLSQINDKRYDPEQANPFLYGLRLGIKPFPMLELGASHLVMFGGPGRRDLSFSEIMETLYSNQNLNDQTTDSNQEFSVDAALTIPNIKKYIFLVDGLKLYVEWGAEDTGLPPDRRAYLTGFALYNPFSLDQAVLRAEYTNTSPNSVPEAWYNHLWYPMNYAGNVFGHHTGSDAEDIFVEWSQDFDKIFYKLSFDRENRGLREQDNTQSKNQYSGEVGCRFLTNSKVALRYTYERIKNFENVDGNNKSNYYLGMELSTYY